MMKRVRLDKSCVPVFPESLSMRKKMSFFWFCIEIARQAAQMKLMRKLEKQALARAAKEARKQQGKTAQRRKHAPAGYAVGQFVTSNYFDLNDCIMKSGRTFLEIHAAFTPFVVCGFIFDFSTLKEKL